MHPSNPMGYVYTFTRPGFYFAFWVGWTWGAFVLECIFDNSTLWYGPNVGKSDTCHDVREGLGRLIVNSVRKWNEDIYIPCKVFDLTYQIEFTYLFYTVVTLRAYWDGINTGADFFLHKNQIQKIDQYQVKWLFWRKIEKQIRKLHMYIDSTTMILKEN